MSNKTNEEKLKILKERLNEINSKNLENNQESSNSEVEIGRKEEISINNSSSSKSNYLKSILIFVFISFGVFYIYSNYDKLFSEEIVEKTIIEEFKYNFNFFNAKNLIIIEKNSSENYIKELKDKMNKKGYSSTYSFLPNVSNSKEKIFILYIGPFYSLEETNQWEKTLVEDYNNYEIIEL